MVGEMGICEYGILVVDLRTRRTKEAEWQRFNTRPMRRRGMLPMIHVRIPQLGSEIVSASSTVITESGH